jgi:4-amino-4-deoxy-L-arabinose transferase-like glycosyltransferase
VRVFGYHSLSVLVPQALMGVASVALVYDLVRRFFGRLGGFIAGFGLAVTPVMVAVSRHNNPDALLVLCCVAAVWFTVRALQDGRTRWLVLAGVCVGLGFETKMGVALLVVPGIVAAWLWVAPAGRGRLHAVRQLLGGGAAMVLVGGAWPALVELTPASQRPWVSGTSDNSVLSLVFGYNGLGRVSGQSGGPAGGGSSMFGGTAGPLRLLNSALGGQASWLLGFALVAGLAILVSSRLRRTDPRSGWLIAVGGAFLASAVLFSLAGGIFHPYYVALLAPFLAALTGAGAATLLGGGRSARILAPLAVIAGVIVELVVRGRYPGQLTWLAPVLIVVGGLAVLALVAFEQPRVRTAALVASLAALSIAPSVWAVDTLGYAASGTFPAGGPASVETAGGGPFGGFGRVRGGSRGGGAVASGSFAFGPPGGFGGAGGSGGAAGPALFGGPGGAGGPGGPGGAAAGGPFGAGGSSLTAVSAYVSSHGGGTIAVSSQSSAATAIIQNGVAVAGIGGFSGRESSVSVAWLAQRVQSGGIRWVLSGGSRGGSGRLPGDTRTGSQSALAAVERACRAVTLPSSASTNSGTLYDCRGQAAALTGASTRESSA